MTPWSREEFMFCKQTWQDVSDDIERAARWFSMIIMSFGGIGRNFGRSTKEKTQQGKLWNSIEGFDELHERFKNITIENLDWRICLKDFDAEHAVFYLDPPYLNAYSCYEERQMLEKDHVEMLDRIFTMKGFVAVSGFENELYNSYPWSNVFLWDIAQSITPYAFTDTNKKKDFGNHTQRSEKIREYLWIKDFRPC
jgi:site-specific DNA-adenine methylase